MGNSFTCFKTQPSYARYHSNSRENVPDLENVVGSILEMDPSLQDRDEGVSKVNTWIDEVSPNISMTPELIEISRWKCIKYWEAQHVTDIYGNEHSPGIKLTGSCVRFYFEHKPDDVGMPRLVIEHCGRTVQVRNAHRNSIVLWADNFRHSIRRRLSVNSRKSRFDSTEAKETESLANRYE